MDELDKKIKYILHKSRKEKSGGIKSKCLSDNMLASYADGSLKDNENEKVEHHLTECGECLDMVILHHKVSQGEALEAVPEVPLSLMNRARSLVKENKTGESLFDIVLKFAQETIDIITNPGNLGISYMAAPVPVRGEKSTLSTKTITLHKKLDIMSTEIEISKTGDSKVNIRIIITDTESKTKVEGLRISLFNPDREMASSIAKDGVTSFRNIIFGKYVIKIIRHGKDLGQISLNIKE